MRGSNPKYEIIAIIWLVERSKSGYFHDNFLLARAKCNGQPRVKITFGVAKFVLGVRVKGLGLV